MYSRHSLTALGLPGRLMIRVWPRVPATPRESMPKGVCCRLMARIASAIPGASRSMTAFVASGVTSRGAKPVPPVVRMRLRCCSSLHSHKVDSMRGRSSGMIAPALMTAPGSCVIIARMFSPLVSWRAPFAPLSLMVSTPMVIILLPGCQFAHYGSDLAACSKEPYGVFVGHVLYLYLALHLRCQFARDVEQLPALSFIAAVRVEGEPAHALVLIQYSVNDFI